MQEARTIKQFTMSMFWVPRMFSILQKKAMPGLFSLLLQLFMAMPLFLFNRNRGIAINSCRRSENNPGIAFFCKIENILGTQNIDIVNCFIVRASCIYQSS